MKYLLIATALTLSACAIHERPVECEWNQELIKDSVCINTKDDAQPKQNSVSSYGNAASGSGPITDGLGGSGTGQEGDGLRYGCNGNGCVSGSGRGRSEGNEKSKKDND